MIREVSCVYRISPQADMVCSTFNLKTGKISGLEDAMELDVNLYYEYREEDYKFAYEPQHKKLMQALCGLPGAYVVIDYNRVGCIVVYKNKHLLYGYAVGKTARMNNFRRPVFEFDTEVIGIMRTPMLTYTTVQPNFYVVVDKTDGIKRIHTDCGVKLVDFEYDTLKDGKPNLSRYIEMCKTAGVYGSYENKGEVKFIYE